MILPEHVSHSSISLWQGCGKRYELQKIERVPEPPAWYLIAGSAIHTATEWLDTGEYDDPEEAWDEAFSQEIFSAEQDWPEVDEWLAAGFANPQTFDHWNPKGLGYVRQWAAGKRRWRDVELDVSMTLPSGIHIKAYVDRVEDYGGSLGIWDLKSGSKRPESDQQLGIYKVLVEETLGIPVSAAFNYMFKDDREYEMDVSRWTVHHVDSLAKSWLRSLEAGVFLPVRSNSCRTCSMRAGCYMESGDTALTRKHDYLNPQYGKAFT